MLPRKPITIIEDGARAEARPVNPPPAETTPVTPPPAQTMGSGVYTIGSEKGYNIVNQLQSGQSTNDLGAEYRPTDGSVWTKNADGSISVMHNGRQLTGNLTYQPAATTPTAPATTPITTTPIVYGESSLVRPSQSENRLTADDIKAMYQQMQDQQNAKIDYTVQQAVDELTRAQEDAQKGFDAQRNKVNLDEAQARDAQVLYAAARGDRGGITARQYDSISNTAATNRHAIEQARQQLATDTARQIADLRAQGEFERADALLQIAQQQLAQLWELQQYNDSLLLQEQQMAMQESSLTGQYNGKPTLDVQLAEREFDYNKQMADREWQYNTSQQEREWAYEIAMQSIQAGIVPDASTLAAAGLDANTASQMANIYKASRASSSGGSGGVTTQRSAGYEDALAYAQNLVDNWENNYSYNSREDAMVDAKKYLDSMVLAGYITGEERDMIYALNLGGVGTTEDGPVENPIPTNLPAMNESHFKASMQSIAAQFQSGKTDAAMDNVDRIISSYGLSDAQQAQLNALLAKFLGA